MDTTNQHLYKTELKDRTLWYDGSSSYPLEHLFEMCNKYDVKYVDQVDSTIVQFNELVAKDREILVKHSCDEVSFNWNIPDQYKHLKVDKYVCDKFNALNVSRFDDIEFEKRVTRISAELEEYKRRGLYDILRVVIFVINTLTAQNAVWGIGRGSSVSSYVLYLIGAHDVDSVAYDLDIGDFLRT